MSFDRRKVRVGKVVSDAMDKTVVVVVEWRRTHPLYKKSMRRRTRFNAHDEENRCRIGDLIRIMETRPLSKTKRWRVVEILTREDIADIQPAEITIDAAVATAAGGRTEVEPAVGSTDTEGATAEVAVEEQSEAQPEADEPEPEEATAAETGSADQDKTTPETDGGKSGEEADQQ